MTIAQTKAVARRRRRNRKKVKPAPSREAFGAKPDKKSKRR